MCLYANVFIPNIRWENMEIPPTPEGLKYTIEKRPHEDLSRFLGGEEGVSMTLHDGHCLCQYKDWIQLFSYIDTIRTLNDLSGVKLLVYWSDNSYPHLEELIIDLNLDDISVKPREGIIYQVTSDITRRLSSWIQEHVNLLFKSNKQVTGIIDSFESNNGNGIILDERDQKPIYFHVKEIKSVEKV